MRHKLKKTKKKFKEMKNDLNIKKVMGRAIAPPHGTHRQTHTTAGARNTVTFLYLDRSVWNMNAGEKEYLNTYSNTHAHKSYLPEVRSDKMNVSVWYSTPPCFTPRIG